MWIEEQPCMQMDFRQFSRNSMHTYMSAFLENSWLFFNPCGKVSIIVAILWSPGLRVQHMVIELWNKNPAYGRQSISWPMRIVAPKPKKNSASKAKFGKKNNFFFLCGNFSLFLSKSFQIWDNFFPFFWPKNSENLKSLDIGLREVGQKGVSMK